MGSVGCVSGLCVARCQMRRSWATLPASAAMQAASAHVYFALALDMTRDDPCHLEWQVKKIPWLESRRPQTTRPLPARPAGESDSTAGMFRRSPKPTPNQIRDLQARRRSLPAGSELKE